MKHKYCGKTLDFPRKPWISGDLRHYKRATWICENDYPAVDGLTVEPIKAKVDSESVGFYIGIEDKNGTPIYIVFIQILFTISQKKIVQTHDFLQKLG